MRVIEGGDGARFPFEAFSSPGFQNLQRDRTIEPRVARAVHVAHSAGTKVPFDTIRANLRPACQ